MSHRRKQVAEEIQRVVSERMIRGLRDPLPGFVTVREVEVNADFTRAQVFVSVIGTEADAKAALLVLKENRGRLRTEVGQRIRLRNTPDLVFVLDETGERAARIHALLKDVKPAVEENVAAAAPEIAADPDPTADEET